MKKRKAKEPIIRTKKLTGKETKITDFLGNNKWILIFLQCFMQVSYVSGILQEVLNVKINTVISEMAVNIEIIRW